MAHSKYSPSSASRYMRCPGSVTLNELLQIEEKPSKFAAEGSAAHELAELCLRNNKDPIAYEGRILEHDGFEFEVDADMIDYVGAYVDEINRRSIDADEVRIEEKIELSNVMQYPDQFGTGDAIIIRGNKVEVHDLKYGKGVKVEAAQNSQMMIYGLGVLEELSLTHDIDELELFIHQPRLDHVDSWVFPKSEWELFTEELREAIRNAESEDPRFLAGEVQCRWCKAKASCKVAAKKVSDSVNADFDVLDPTTSVPAVAECLINMSVDDLEIAFEHIGFIESWCQAVKDRMIAEAMDGHTKNFKPVRGRAGARSWKDPVEAEEMMKGMRLKQDEIYDKKLISPAAAEKLLKTSPKRWTRLQELVTQGEGKPTVVPMSDKRQSIAIANDFDEISNDSAEEFDDLI